MSEGTINLINKTASFDGRSIQLNEFLLIKNNVSNENIEKLLNSHLELMKLKSHGWKLDPEVNIDELKSINARMSEIFFEQQSLWGFEKDQELHEFWTAPHCTCPKNDNKEEWLNKLSSKNKGNNFTAHYNIKKTCPIHGGSL